ncbi:MAG: CPBP family intramembrane metalloprotease [Pirellulales bacterium]|nr:CPBP family intramembrane metalloprotease [Pirellulales bacterium]
MLPSFVTLAYFVWAQGSAASVQQTVYAIAKVVQFAFPVFWVAKIQRQKLQFDLTSSRGVMLGGIFGAVVFFAGLVVYHSWLKSADFFLIGQQPMQEKIAGLGLDSAWKFVALGVFYSLVHSLLEEYYWRWFVFGQLKALVSLRLAIVISALGFMAHHVIVIGTYFGFFTLTTWLFSLAVAFGGVFWAWLYHRSGSLLGPWLSHLLVDAAIFTIGYEIAQTTHLVLTEKFWPNMCDLLASRV